MATHTHVLQFPPPKDVANAVGAALGIVSGSCDYIEDLAQIKQELVDAKVEEEGDKLDKKAREVAEQRGVERARKEAIDKGGYEHSLVVLKLYFRGEFETPSVGCHNVVTQPRWLVLMASAVGMELKCVSNAGRQTSCSYVVLIIILCAPKGGLHWLL